MADNQYFGALPTDEIADALVSKIDKWDQFTRTSETFDRMLRCHEAYYGYNGSDHLSSEISSAGIQGELSLIKVNHLRNIIRHMLIMTTSQRPSVEARAINTDYESVAQVVLANGVLDYYMREKKLERYIEKAVEISLVFGEGYVGLEWDTALGDEFMFDEESQKMIYTGDIKYEAYTPLQVIKDVYRPDSEDQDWYMVIKYKNKYDLIAKYPELEEEILKIEPLSDRIDNQFYYGIFQENTDLIPTYLFYHKKTEALPDGRFVYFASDDAVFYDDSLPYDEIPIYQVSPGDFIGSNLGYTPAFDLLGIQESIDILYSTVITNQATFGVQNIMAPRGHGIETTQLGGGLNLIEYDPQTGPPQPLNLTRTPPEVFNFIAQLEKVIETISGVNATVRGNPEANLRSGSALALVQSMAIQYNSGLQQAYAQLLEDVSTATVKTLQKFGSIPRVAAITGKNNRTYLKKFTGEDLNKVTRFVVDVANPLARTTAGKLEIATEMLRNGVVKTPQEYLMVLKTGNLDPLYEGEFQELTLIKSENEKLAAGDSAQATLVDSHIEHIKEHRSVLASPEARANPEVVQATLDHIQQHIDLMRSESPDVQAVLQILEQPILPPLNQAPSGAAPMEGGGPSPKAVGRATEEMADVVRAQDPTMDKVRQINMPRNPATGERAQVPVDTPVGGEEIFE